MTTVRDLMTSPPTTVPASATLSVASAMMDEAGVSALPVLDARGRTVGVISRTDLVHAGVLARASRRESLMPLPNATVESVMGHALVSVEPSASAAEAARLMVDQHIHRVFVESGRELIGVLSATDLMRLVARSNLSTTLRSVMRSPVAAVPSDTPLSVALAELESHDVGALVVMEHDEPVGLFTRDAALAARDLSDDTPVADAMVLRYVVEAPTTEVHHAAARAVSMGARHILVRDATGIVGVVTRLDLAGVVLLAH